MAPIRRVTYNHDGTILGASEAADWIHLYDVTSNYSHEQTIEFFGECSGISFSPSSNTLFAGINDGTYGSLMEFSKITHNTLENILI